VKLGIIGLGHMGGYHASACSLISGIKLIGVADVAPQNLAKVTNPTVLKSNNFQDWLPSVDAVIIAVPTELHYEITKTCLLANKHVLLEKPLTKSLDQAKDLFKIAQERGLALHVGHVERFNGAVQELKKIIHEPYLIESQRIGPFSSRVQHDSVVLDLMIHDLDIIVGLIDSPVRKVTSVGRSISSQLCDLANVHLEFENNVIAHVTSSRASQVKRRTMVIHQKDAFIELDFTTQDIFIHRQTSESVKVGHNQLKYKQESMVERLFVYKDNPLKLEIEHFAEAIKQETRLIDPAQDLVALELALTIDAQLKK